LCYYYDKVNKLRGNKQGVDIMTRWSNLFGSRGYNLEEMLNQVHRLYDKRKLALITKIPVPIKVLRIANKKIVEAFFEEKSILDYQGIVQGNAVSFDAKETNLKYLPLKNIHKHQIEYMKKFDRQRGLTFIIAHFKTVDRFFLIPVDTVYEYYINSLKGGRKSIPLEELDTRYEIITNNGLPDYLEVLERYRKDKHKKWKRSA
jgi:recombination protein U